jgi:murein L,D-transpeptidase YcbB/YkuD
MNLGQAIQIALRLITHYREIGELWPRAIAVSGDLQRMLPEAQRIITEAAGIASSAHDLLSRIAPELMPRAAALAQPQYDVRWLQSSLNSLTSANLAVDGEMGPLTIGAVRRFQSSHGLVADGWAGVLTTALVADLMHDIGYPEGHA